MKIVADENMPHVRALFSTVADVTLLPGRTICAEDLMDVDVLLVRSVTKVDEALLKYANKLKYVGSATIGMDHIDADCLTKRGIQYTNAPGCNAQGVGQYVASSVMELALRSCSSLSGKQVSIVGAGNTGTAAAAQLMALGMDVQFYDPYLEAAGDARKFCDWDSVLNSDIISFHVPLTADTHHLLNANNLPRLKEDVWLINASRGAVLDNQALVTWRSNRPNSRLVLDVWEGEPAISSDVVDVADIATPHIAGYSVQGKARGTYMLYQWLMEKVQRPLSIMLDSLTEEAPISSVTITKKPSLTRIYQLSQLCYQIMSDDAKLRHYGLTASGFDGLRKAHNYRNEFSALTVQGNAEHIFALLQLGFRK